MDSSADDMFNLCLRALISGQIVTVGKGIFENKIPIIFPLISYQLVSRISNKRMIKLKLTVIF